MSSSLSSSSLTSLILSSPQHRSLPSDHFPLSPSQKKIVFETIIQIHTHHHTSRPSSPLSQRESNNAILDALTNHDINISETQLKTLITESKKKNSDQKASARGKENRRKEAQLKQDIIQQEYEAEKEKKKTRAQKAAVFPPKHKEYHSKPTRTLSDMSQLKVQAAQAIATIVQQNRDIAIVRHQAAASTASQQQFQPNSIAPDDSSHSVSQQSVLSSVSAPVSAASSPRPQSPSSAAVTVMNAEAKQQTEVKEPTEVKEQAEASNKKKRSKRKAFIAGVMCMCTDNRTEKERRVERHDEMISLWTEESRLAIEDRKLSIELHRQQSDLNRQQTELNRLALANARQVQCSNSDRV